MTWSFPGAASRRSRSRARAPIRRTIRPSSSKRRWRGRTAPCRLRSLRRDRCGRRVGPSVCGFSAAYELLPAVLQAEGQAARRREGDQTLSCSGHALFYARALAHPKLTKAVKRRLHELYRTLDPVVLLAEMRDAQTELGTRARVDCRASKIAAVLCTPPPAPDAAAFAKGLGKAVLALSSAPSIGACTSPTRNGCGCHRCSILASRRSTAGSRPSHA